MNLGNPGTLEPWNPGTLEPWNLGTLEPGNLGTLEPWNPGTLEPWNLGTVEPWNPNKLRLARKRYKPNGQPAFFAQLPVAGFCHHQQFLIFATHWNHHPAACFQLIDQRLRNVIGRGSHYHRIEGRMLGPAGVSIT